MTKPGKPKQRRDPRRRAETTLLTALPAVGGAPAHDVGSLLVVALEATVLGIGLVTFTAPSAAQLFLTSSRQRAREADALRLRVLRNRKMVPGPRGLEPLLREQHLFPFLEAAMAAIVLGYTALDNFTTEMLPDDFSIPDPKTGAVISRDQVERRGFELRLSAGMAGFTGRPNLMTSEPELWTRCMRLKERREALGHLKATKAFATSSLDAADNPPNTVWGDLLGIQSYQDEVVGVVQSAMAYFGPSGGSGSGSAEAMRGSIEQKSP